MDRWIGRPLVRQVVRFAAVGALATLVHYAILVALVEGARLQPVTSTTIGFLAGLALSYTLNRRYTFESDVAHGATLVKYIALYGVGMLLNGAIVAALIGAGVIYILAQIVATGIVLVWNFAGARWLVFGVRR